MVPVPPSLRAAGFRSRSRASLGQRPLGLLSALVDVESRRLHDYRWGPHFNERAHALELFPSLRAGDTVVMDRGYFSRELLRAAHRLGVRVLLRLRSNALGEVIEWTTRAAPSRLPPTTDVEIAGVPCRLSAYRAHGTRFLCLATARGPVWQLHRRLRPPPTQQAQPWPHSQPPLSARRRSASWPGMRQATAAAPVKVAVAPMKWTPARVASVVEAAAETKESVVDETAAPAFESQSPPATARQRRRRLRSHQSPGHDEFAPGVLWSGKVQ